MSAQPPPPPQWVLDLNSTPAPKQKPASIPDPPGFTAAHSLKQRSGSKAPVRKAPTPEEMDTLKMKKAWEVAIAPAKQLPMNAIGMSFGDRSIRHDRMLILSRHVHDRKLPPNLLHLHGLHALQVTHHRHSLPSPRLCTVRDPRHIIAPYRR